MKSKDLVKMYEGLYGEFNPGEWYWLVSYSGGKDSTLLLITLLKFAESRGFKIHVVYNDTGGDVPELRNLAYRVLEFVKARGHVIHVTRPEKAFFDYLLTQYSPPRWNFRWCCRLTKERPFINLARELSREKPVLNFLGLRREEARWRNWFMKRANDRLIYVAPLNNLSNSEVWELLRSESEGFMDFAYHELRKIYGDAQRSGCWYCPLVIKDKFLESKPELLKLKYEVLNSWCTGRREKIIELSRKYPDLIRITININEVSHHYPCGRKCTQCQVFKERRYLLKILKNEVR